jgi:excisionase family DNA binding protein
MLDVLASEVETADADDLDLYAERLAPLLDRVNVRRRSEEPADSEPDRWLSAKDAARHLGLSLNALYKLTRAGEIPFEQDGPMCKLWFRRSELDDWRCGRWNSTRRA